MRLVARRCSRGGLGVFEGFVEGLRYMGSAQHDAPAVVVFAESDRGFVMQIAGVEGGADFVERSPFPREVDIGSVGVAC